MTKANAIRVKYKACPKCTYPLKEVQLDETHKRIYCSNNRCDHERIIKIRRKKWQ